MTDEEENDEGNLYDEAAKQADSTVREEVQAVMDLLESQLEQCDSIDGVDEMAAAGEAIANTADLHGEADEALEWMELKAADIAQSLSLNGGKDRIIGTVEGPVKELARRKEQERVEDMTTDGASEFGLDRGTAIDNYVEEHLERVLRLDTRDHMTDPSYVFEFVNGSSVQFDDYDHRSYPVFYDAVSGAAPGGERVLDKIASKQAADEISGDPWDDDDEDAREKYRRLSAGPEDRLWGVDWNEVITSLEAEAEEMGAEPAGPRTDAWEDLQGSIREARAAENKQSVVDAGLTAVYYDSAHDEVWVPTEIVDNAVTDYATTRKGLVHELDARGVTTDEISGVGCSEVVFVLSRPTRFWRLDASHDEVPFDESEVVDELVSDDPFGTGSTEYGEGGAD